MDEEAMRRVLQRARADEGHAVLKVWRLLADNMTVENLARHHGLSVAEVLVQTGGEPAVRRVMASLALAPNDEIKALIVLLNTVT